MGNLVYQTNLYNCVTLLMDEPYVMEMTGIFKTDIDLNWSTDQSLSISYSKFKI